MNLIFLRLCSLLSYVIIPVELSDGFLDVFPQVELNLDIGIQRLERGSLDILLVFSRLAPKKKSLYHVDESDHLFIDIVTGMLYCSPVQNSRSHF